MTEGSNVPTLPEIRQSLEVHLHQREREVEQIKAMLAPLQREAPTPPTNGRKRRKRAPQGQREQQAYEFLAATPNESYGAREIATALGINESTVYKLLPRLKAAGKAKKYGSKWKAVVNA